MSAAARSPLSRMCAAMRFVGKGTNAMHINSRRLSVRKVVSATAITRMHAWWFTHMIPIVRNETA